MLLRFLAIVLVLFSAPAAARKPAAERSSAEVPAEPVIAVVNGLVITESEFASAAAKKQPADGVALTEAERAEVLQRLIDDRLLYQEALAKGLDKDPKVQKVMVNELLSQEIYATVQYSDFTDAELRRYYDAHHDQFIVPEKVQIKLILIKVTDQRPEAAARARAEALLTELRASPELFSRLASERSEDPYRRRGGDAGFVSREGKPGLDMALVDAAFKLEIGQISDLVRTEQGFYIVMAAARRDQVERTFEQMKGSVLRQAKNDEQRALYNAHVAELQRGAKVKIDEDALSGVKVTFDRSASLDSARADTAAGSGVPEDVLDEDSDDSMPDR